VGRKKRRRDSEQIYRCRTPTKKEYTAKREREGETRERERDTEEERLGR
jgi:hypothetical protein